MKEVCIDEVELELLKKRYIRLTEIVEENK